MKSSIVDRASLPEAFPTHLHSPQLWEQLGRTVATFGFLEEVLGKAIFAFGATREYDEKELDEALKRWVPELEKALTSPLRPLIDGYERAVKAHQASDEIMGFDALIGDLRQANRLRNALCHGSWRAPNSEGKSSLNYIDKKFGKFESQVDEVFLVQTQKATAELAICVIETVTHMGWQFPGGAGPGIPIIAPND